MKKLLSDFVNLFYPKQEGETWTWGEIFFVLGILGFVMFMVVMFHP
jgi:hypothetical protein